MKKTRMRPERTKTERRLLLCAGKPMSLIILAGGRSRRMGRSKALLPVAGKTLLEHVLGQVEGCFDDIVISLSPGQRLTPDVSARRTRSEGRTSPGHKDRASHDDLPRGGNEARCRRSGHRNLGRGLPDRKKEAAGGGRALLGERIPPLRFVRDAVSGQGPMAGILAGLKAARHDVCAVVACDIPDVPIGLLRRMAREAALEYEAVVPMSAAGLVEPLFAVYRRTAARKMEALLAAGRMSLLPLLASVKTRRLPLEDRSPLRNLNTPDDYSAYLESAARRRRRGLKTDRRGQG